MQVHAAPCAVYGAGVMMSLKKYVFALQSSGRSGWLICCFVVLFCCVCVFNVTETTYFIYLLKLKIRQLLLKENITNRLLYIFVLGNRITSYFSKLVFKLYMF